MMIQTRLRLTGRTARVVVALLSTALVLIFVGPVRHETTAPKTGVSSREETANGEFHTRATKVDTTTTELSAPGEKKDHPLAL